MQMQDLDTARLLALGGVKFKNECATHAVLGSSTIGLPAYRASTELPTPFSGFLRQQQRGPISSTSNEPPLTCFAMASAAGPTRGTNSPSSPRYLMIARPMIGIVPGRFTGQRECAVVNRHGVDSPAG
jgi:hypothetical protein